MIAISKFAQQGCRLGAEVQALSTSKIRRNGGPIRRSARLASRLKVAPLGPVVDITTGLGKRIRKDEQPVPYDTHCRRRSKRLRLAAADLQATSTSLVCSPSTGTPTISAAPSLLTYLPCEIILSIIEAAELEDLPFISRTCHHLRQLAVPVYLRRLDVLQPQTFSHRVRLVGDLPADTVPILCSTSHINSAYLQLDLQYLIDHYELLQQFLARVTRISSINIFIYKQHNLLHQATDQLAETLCSFVASLSARQCYDFSIEYKHCWPKQSSYAPTYPRIEPQKNLTQRMRTFASHIEEVDLCLDLFTNPTLSRVALSFTHSPSIIRLSIRGSYPFNDTDFSSALSHFQLPSLEEVTFYGPVSSSDLARFLIRHPTVREVTLACSVAPLSVHTGNPVSLASVSSAVLSANSVPAFFSAFELPSLVSLTVIAAPCDNWASSLCHALDAISPDGGELLDRLSIIFSIGPDFGGKEGASLVTEDISLPKYKLLGISELDVLSLDAFEAGTSLRYFLRLLAFFPSLNKLDIRSGCIQPPSIDFTSSIRKSCPKLLYISSPWGNWVND